MHEWVASEPAKIHPRRANILDVNAPCARNACIWNTIGTIFYVKSVAVKWVQKWEGITWSVIKRVVMRLFWLLCNCGWCTSLSFTYKAAGYLRSSETHGHFVGTGRRNHEQNLDQRGLTSRPRRALGYLWTLAGPDFPVPSSFSPESRVPGSLRMAICGNNARLICDTILKQGEA